MSTSQHSIEVRGIVVVVDRKPIKHLHVSVYPPVGRVRVAAPLRVDDDAIRLAVISKLGWIRRKQRAFVEQDRQSQREMVTGESHYVWGQRYRLDVIEKEQPPRIQLEGNYRLKMAVRPNTTATAKRDLLDRWYRNQLRAEIPELLDKWEPTIGEQTNEWGIKKMKTKWGSCNPTAKRLWLNLELAKKPPMCLEYVLVHEMVHLLERSHNNRFRELMDTFMPNWRLYRDELNRTPLAHEDWAY